MEARSGLAEVGSAGKGLAGPEDVPVGAVILDEAGTVIARARNRREIDRDPTAHAEVVAIRQAARALGSWRLTGLTLVVTLEPCTMCAGAVTAARLARVVYGAEDPKAGAVGSLWDVLRDTRLNHRPEVIGGVLAARIRVSSRAVESPSGRGRTPRKRVRGQPLRGFKSHLHRSAGAACTFGVLTGNLISRLGRSLL